MDELWRRLERWLIDHAPAAVFRSLGEPATDEAIDALEAAIGYRLPDDVRASYRLHDGQRWADPNEAPPGLIDAREFLSLERIRGEWSVLKGLLDSGTFEGDLSEPQDPGIRTDWWSPGWIPLTYDGSGNHDCLDLTPAEGGTPGQIIAFWHDDAERLVLAPSFRAWFEAFVAGCESGAYGYSEEYGGIVDLSNV